VALVLAGIGTYGLVSYSVAQRTYEISLRMAIGATSSEVVRMILYQSLRVSFAGAVAGLVAAVFLTQALSALLFEVSATDPLAFGIASVFLLFVATLASSLPAWRASRIDPARTLRAE